MCNHPLHRGEKEKKKAALPCLAMVDDPGAMRKKEKGEELWK